MSKSKTRIKTEAAGPAVPQTRDEVTASIAAIGVAQRQRQRIDAAMNDELAVIKAKHETAAKPFADEISALSKGVHLWCEANRDSLTNGGKTKTANLASGEVKWRMRPPSVGIRAVDAVLEALKALGLSRLIRTKEEVNKEAILLEPKVVEHVKGISISQKEDFVIVPFESELEEVV